MMGLYQGIHTCWVFFFKARNFSTSEFLWSGLGDQVPPLGALLIHICDHVRPRKVPPVGIHQK